MLLGAGRYLQVMLSVFGSVNAAARRRESTLSRSSEIHAVRMVPVHRAARQPELTKEEVYGEVVSIRRRSGSPGVSPKPSSAAGISAVGNNVELYGENLSCSSLQTSCTVTFPANGTGKVVRIENVTCEVIVTNRVRC